MQEKLSRSILHLPCLFGNRRDGNFVDMPTIGTQLGNTTRTTESSQFQHDRTPTNARRERCRILYFLPTFASFGRHSIGVSTFTQRQNQSTDKGEEPGAKIDVQE